MSQIPGNRPEDEAWVQWVERLTEHDRQQVEAILDLPVAERDRLLDEFAEKHDEPRFEAILDDLRAY